MLSVLYTKPHNEIKIIGSSFMEDVIDEDLTILTTGSDERI